VDITLVPITNDFYSAKLIFREDYFDAVTRVRRGRFYASPGTQPQEWRVQAHPAFSGEPGGRDLQGWLIKSLHGYQAWSAFPEQKNRIGKAIVALGTRSAHTLWRLIDIERTAIGDDMVTMRARTSLGLLPELVLELIPSRGREKLVETMDKLSDAAYRESPEAIVDRARAVAQWAIGAWLAERDNDERLQTTDLGQLAIRLGDGNQVTRGLAQIIARLHVRVKPNEQELRGLRPVTEADAELALAATGLLLRELGWAR
jgi:hypothetical protein